MMNTTILDQLKSYGVALDDCETTTFGALVEKHEVGRHGNGVAVARLDAETEIILLPGWVVDDDYGNARIYYPHLDTKREAADEYVLGEGGDFGEHDSTAWITTWVWRHALAVTDDGDVIEINGIDRDRLKVAIEPDEPDCDGYSRHDWQSIHELVGGIEENPGVHGSGGGVTIRRVCVQCGRYREVDTWAYDPVDGEQGLESVRYEDADDDSLDWVAKHGEGEE
jgi:hypothetical protein